MATTFSPLATTPPAPSMPPLAPMPTSGREAAALRLALGVSQNAVARELGMATATYARWEASSAPLPQERREQWQGALKACAAHRMRDLARLGLRTTDLPSLPLARLLRLLTAC